MTTNSHNELVWLTESKLRSPIVVLAFEGLFDAAEAATSGVRHLADAYPNEAIAEIDGERFFDFTQRRPTVAFDEDGFRSISWPENKFFAAKTEHEHDLILLAGVEPHLRWRTFASHVADVVTQVGASMVATVGAMVGLAPHTRTLGVVASSSDPGLAEQLGLNKPSYEGPTGLVGALHEELTGRAIPTISLRVSVPHYVPGPPNPEASRSLLARFELVTGIATNHAALDENAADWRERVAKAVDRDPEMIQYVKNLEDQVDDHVDNLLPSGDDIAAQLQAFLRANPPSEPGES